MKIIIVMGPPGSGKGTQAKMLKEKYAIAHISTGELFRHELEHKTELGLQAKSFMDKGEYVPDEVTIAMLKGRIEKEDCKEGFILDGFPRTIPQAEFLEKMLSEKDLEVDEVFYYKVEDALVVDRIKGRAEADRDNGREVRADDLDSTTIQKRLNTYHTQTEPVLLFYREKGLLDTLDASEEIDEIYEDSTFDLEHHIHHLGI